MKMTNYDPLNDPDPYIRFMAKPRSKALKYIGLLFCLAFFGGLPLLAVYLKYGGF